MRKWSVLALWVAAALGSASGQQATQAPSAPPAGRPQPVEEPQRFRGYGYGYFAVGGTCCSFSNLLGFGGGGEALLYKGLGAGIDLGYVFPRANLACGIGLLTVNPSYHLVNRSKPKKVMPFVTAGYALAFRAGATSAWNYGGGLTWWLSGKKGLRVEIRDYRDRCGGSLHVIRTSVAFR